MWHIGNEDGHEDFTWIDLRLLQGLFDWVDFREDGIKRGERGRERNLLGCLVGQVCGRKIGEVQVFSSQISEKTEEKTWMLAKDQFCPSLLCLAVLFVR